jgi:hypothetical protein
MTNELENIKRAVAEANPEEWKGKMVGDEYVTRHWPIRLTDVLLALYRVGHFTFITPTGIEKKSVGAVIAVDVTGSFWTCSGDLIKSYVWNLKNDNLTKQSPETIAFLSTLLTTK